MGSVVGMAQTLWRRRAKTLRAVAVFSVQRASAKGQELGVEERARISIS